jgi:acyl-CoA reductase-like NAD-dependent aldehyde dehydrogenase
VGSSDALTDAIPVPAAGLLRSHIAGAWEAGLEVVRDENPAHPAQTVADVSLAGAELADRAITTAADAWPSWAATPGPDRAWILRRAARIVSDRRMVIGTALAMEEGKTLGEAVGETDRAAAILEYFAGQALEPDGETYPSHAANTLLFARRVPIGVVLAVTPWNFPIAIPAWKIAPALAFGNTVVWKPAEITPLTAVHFMAAFEEAGLPPGVLNLVLGRSRDVGSVLTAHRQLDAITFTGSNEVGRAIQRSAIAAGKRVQLELGGKNPAVVLGDADLAVAAELVARGAFLSAGQKCTATSRVIVERSVVDEFRDRLVALAEAWPVGDPLVASTKVGPLASSAQFDRVRDLVGAAVRGGARVLAGGVGPIPGEDGYFFRPTVLDDVGSRDDVAQTEVFGPIAAILPVADATEAIALANDTPFGLVASLFTTNLAEALRFARECRAGLVKVNQETAGIEYQAPFGGTKDSSSGSREQGKAAREFMTEWKTIAFSP